MMPTVVRDSEDSKRRLITMPHSHFCEKARWALDYCELGYTEEPHLLILHRQHTGRVGGSSVPVLVTPTTVFTSSASITAYAHAQRPSIALIPSDTASLSLAISWEEQFDRALGPHARRWAYSQLLSSKAVLQRIASAGVPLLERWAAPAIITLARPLLKRGFKLNASAADESLAEIERVFSTVGAHLKRADFLAGDRFSIADLAFASLAAPVLGPQNFGGAALLEEETPPGMKVVRDRLRATSAGKFAMAVYDSYRRRPNAARDEAAGLNQVTGR